MLCIRGGVLKNTRMRSVRVLLKPPSPRRLKNKILSHQVGHSHLGNDSHYSKMTIYLQSENASAGKNRKTD
jgi:hypothetical protein